MNFLFRLLYDVAIQCYYCGIVVTSWWNKKARLFVRGRKNLFHQIKKTIRQDEYRVWFHCASVGEFEQGRTVIEAYRKKFPGHRIVLTFFSPSGFELLQNYPGADYIFYLPLDTKRNARQFVSLIDPKITVFVKYEFWLHILSEIHRRNIPSVMISAIFHRNHFLFNAFFKPLKQVMLSFRKIFVQDEDSKLLLHQHGFANAELAGDTRFDRVWEIASSPKEISIIKQFKGDLKLFVAGSTWPPDNALIFQLAGELNQEWKFVVVPHEVNSAHLVRLKNESKLPLIFFSEWEGGKKFSEEKILIVDKMGLLSSIYQYADMAYVGGGFGKGIHNTLEAAAFGIPVLFGPHYEKFNEAKMLIENKGGRSVKNYSELKEAVQFFLQNESKEPKKSNREWVRRHTGSTAIIIAFLEQLNSDTGASPA